MDTENINIIIVYNTRCCVIYIPVSSETGYNQQRITDYLFGIILVSLVDLRSDNSRSARCEISRALFTGLKSARNIKKHFLRRQEIAKNAARPIHEILSC